MKQSINNFTQFHRAFIDAGRGDQYPVAVLEVIYNAFEQYEDDTGEEIELDVIAICCDIDYGTMDEIRADYGIDGDMLDYLHENTWVLGIVDDVVVYEIF